MRREASNLPGRDDSLIYLLSAITNKQFELNKKSRMVSGDGTSVSNNRSKLHRPDLDPKFINELMRSLRLSYKIIGGKNIDIPGHLFKYIKKLGPIDAVKHYKYFTSKWISAFSLDILEEPSNFDENKWFFNNHNMCYMKRRLKKFRFAFQLWQGKRAIRAPLPDKVKEQDYEKFRSRLTQDLTVDYQLLETIRKKAKEYFRAFKAPSLRMTVTNKSCFEGKNQYETIRKDYNIPIIKPYRNLRELAINNIAAKYNYEVFEPHGTSVQLDEPLKVRTITKMHYGQLQYKGLQESLLQYIQKKSPEFILTKTPHYYKNSLKSSDIWNQIKTLVNEPYEEYCSGDYEAATDNLKRRVITSIVEQIPMGDAQIQFGPALIDDFVTTNGQLMGSILSFPILCIINKFVYEYVQQLVPNSSSRPFINGDDILFKANRTFINKWLEITQEVGFIPSKGKSLVSKNYFSINSRPYSTLGPLKFANFKLTNVKGSCEEECQALREFHLESTGELLSEDNIHKSMYYFKDFGTSQSFKIWRKFKSEYIDVEAGGLGLFPNNEKKMKPLQKWYSSYILTRLKETTTSPLQREVGVSPYFVKKHDKNKREPVPKYSKYRNKTVKLTTMSTPELEKLRYGMLSSRYHDSEACVSAPPISVHFHHRG